MSSIIASFISFPRIRRAVAAVAVALVGANGILAQAVSPPAATPSSVKDEEPVQLAAFEVVMTQDKGYFSPYAGLALKTNEEIMKTPQSITVLTRDLIDDIASVDLSDMLNYVGVGNFQQGDSAYVRGNNANLNTDGAGDGSPSMAPDSATIDSITIVRGPIAVLYGGNSSITGAVVRQTRVPLGRRQTMVRGQIDEWGFHRAELDHSSPLGQIGAARFSGRLDLAYQDGDTFLRNVTSRQKIWFGVVQMQYKNTTLRLNAQHQDIRQPFHKTTVMTPEGLPWLGAGRDESLTDSKSLIRSSTNQARGSSERRCGSTVSRRCTPAISRARR